MKDEEKLAKYVHDALAAGHSREQIRTNLTAASWAEKEVNRALNAWHDDASAIGPPVPKPGFSVPGRDVFSHGLLFLALLMTTYHLISLGGSIIDFWLTDELLAQGAPIPVAFRIRFSAAWLIVFFPVFLILNSRINRSLAANNNMGRSQVRKWFCYTTLFLTVLVFLGTLIAVVHSLLTGGFTLPFFAKVVLTAVVAGAVFLYFRKDLVEENHEA